MLVYSSLVPRHEVRVHREGRVVPLGKGVASPFVVIGTIT